LQAFKIISFNHQQLPLETIGKLHLDEEAQTHHLGALKLNFQFDELMFLSTCNRVELYVKTELEITLGQIENIIRFINSGLSPADVHTLANHVILMEGDEAVLHVFKVASSLNSLVVGEREIITQLRKAYDFCNMLGLTGDFTRLLMKQTIETAKQVFTETNIAKNPVSVVSLAYRRLREQGIKNDARILIVGAGDTNTKMANYLQKHKFANFSVFNRSLNNAEKLAELLNGQAQPLSELKAYKNGFDVLIVCTASATPIITQEVYNSLLQGDISKKVVIDLSIPANVDAEVVKSHSLLYIDINSLKQQADQNMQLRKSEITVCESILHNKLDEFKWLQKERRIELAFGEVPKQVKAIKDMALTEVFAKEINELDLTSKEVLDKVISYIEKKYNAVAMKTAKEVFLKDE
jgi:glutamyl-tRNA reductase